MKYFYSLLILLAIPGCGGNLSETSELSQDPKDSGTTTDSALNPGDASPDSGDASPDSKVDAGETSTGDYLFVPRIRSSAYFTIASCTSSSMTVSDNWDASSTYFFQQWASDFPPPSPRSTSRMASGV